MTREEFLKARAEAAANWNKADKALVAEFERTRAALESEYFEICRILRLLTAEGFSRE